MVAVATDNRNPGRACVSLPPHLHAAEPITLIRYPIQVSTAIPRPLFFPFLSEVSEAREAREGFHVSIISIVSAVSIASSLYYYRPLRPTSKQIGAFANPCALFACLQPVSHVTITTTRGPSRAHRPFMMPRSR